MQFNKFEELVKKGYQAAKDILDKFEVENRLPSAIVGEDDISLKRKNGKSARRNSI